MIHFASPWFLILLLPAAGAFFRQKSLQKRQGLYVSGPLKTFAFPPTMGVFLSEQLLPWLKILAIALMILALARPQAGEQKLLTTSRGINIILALDLSESMKAMDFKLDKEIVDRLTAVKSVVNDFIAQRTSDRIGMVVLGSHAFTQMPLTQDANALAFMLDHLRIGAAGPNTAIGDAIGISLKRLSHIPSDSNVIILLTDGQSNAGSLSWQEAVDIASRKKVKIYTIGVGTRGKAPFLVDGIFGKRFVYQQVNVDMEALKIIAEKTGGKFFKADDTTALTRIYESINSLEKTKLPVEKWVAYKELFPAFLMAGMGIYLLYIVLRNTRFLQVP